MNWVYEANHPGAQLHYFSPILDIGSGVYGVYSTIGATKEMARYNFSTQAWTTLAASTNLPRTYLALSPDASKVAIGSGAVADQAKTIEIYNIAGDSWSISSDAPQMSSTDAYIRTLVWEDNDTIWVVMRAYISGTYTTKCYKYVVSTDSWTQYTNSFTFSGSGSIVSNQVAITSDKSTLYISWLGVATGTQITRYVIASDAYTDNVGSLAAGTNWHTNVYDRTRLWYAIVSSSYDHLTGYIDADDLSQTSVLPVNNDSQVSGGNEVRAGVIQISGVFSAIARYRTSNPFDMSYNMAAGSTVRSYGYIIG